MPEHKPTIIIDTREQHPLPIKAYPTIVEGLPVGDYSIQHFHDFNNPKFTIERKSLEDLCGSLGSGRERFMKEIRKMRQFEFRALVIEAVEDQVNLAQYRSMISPASVLATLDAIMVRANVHVLWCGNAEGAARKVENLVRQFVRGIEKQHAYLVPRGKPSA